MPFHGRHRIVGVHVSTPAIIDAEIPLIVVSVQHEGMTALVRRSTMKHRTSGIDFIADEFLPLCVGIILTVIITHRLVIAEISGQVNRGVTRGPGAIRRIIHLAHDTQIITESRHLSPAFGRKIAGEGHLVPFVGMSQIKTVHMVLIASLLVIPSEIIGSKGTGPPFRPGMVTHDDGHGCRHAAARTLLAVHPRTKIIVRRALVPLGRSQFHR